MDAPDWFHLDDYDSLKSLEVHELQFQLRQRQILNGLAESDPEPSPLDLDRINHWIEEGPILKLPRVNTFADPSREPRPSERSLVKDLSPYQAFTIVKRIEPFARQHPNSSLRELFTLGSHENQPAFVEVDLHARKSEILRAFEGWLNDHHSKPKTVGDKPHTILNKLFLYKVFPYIDLKLIWGSANGIRVPVKDLADWIDLDIRHVDEQTRKYASDALSDAFINSLSIR